MLNEEKRHQCGKTKQKLWNQKDTSFDSVEDKEVEDGALRALKDFQKQEGEENKVPVKGKSKPDTDTKKFS